jgi:hypothetical protein
LGEIARGIGAIRCRATDIAELAKFSAAEVLTNHN